MAEDERERITKRANGGRQAAKARGVKFGRKAKLTQHQIEIARQRMQAGESARSIAQAAAERSDEILMLPSVQCYNVALVVKKAGDKKLKEALETHRTETEGQVDRLEQVFKLMDVPARGKKCGAIEGILEAKEHMDDIEDAKVLDAGMIGSAQAVEHYEITRYGTLIAWARQLGHDNAIPFSRGQSQRGEACRRIAERDRRDSSQSTGGGVGKRFWRRLIAD